MAKWETTDAAWIDACAASKARDTDMISRADAIALVEDEMPGRHYLSKKTQIVTKLRALSAAMTQAQDHLGRWVNTAAAQDQIIFELRDALTQSRAETAAAYEVAATEAAKRAKFTRVAIIEATAKAIVANLVSVTQTKTSNEIEDAIRALATPDQSSALVAIEAAAEARGMRKAAEICVNQADIWRDEKAPIAAGIRHTYANARNAIIAAIPQGEK